MNALDIAVEDPRWHDLGLETLAARAITAALTHLAIDPDLAEVSILACDDGRIADLNADFRGKPQPTNVLSWPSDERGAEQDGGNPLPVEPDFDGAFEAEIAGKSMAHHVSHLTVHGLLHLLGYDHERDADATLMERIEVEILGKLGIDDPYRDHASA